MVHLQIRLHLQALQPLLVKQISLLTLKNPSTYGCTVMSKDQLQVTIKKSISNAYSANIAFRNPYSEVTFKSITIQYDRNCNSSPDFSTTTTFPTAPFIKGSISTTSIDSFPRIIGSTTAVLTMSFTPTYGTAKGFVDLKFPAWYSVGGVASSTPMITVSSPSSDCFTTLSNLVIDTCAVSGQILQYTFSSYTGGNIQFKLNNFKNPVNRYVKSGFQIIHRDQDGFIIAQSGDTLSLASSMDTATSISTPTFEFGDSRVSTITSLKITFTYPIPTELFCYIQITFPSDLPINQASIKGYQGTGFFNNDDTSAPNALDGSYISWSGQTMKIDACKSSSKIATTLTTGPIGSITISDLQVPNQVKTTDLFTINTYQSNSYSASDLIASGSFSVPDTAIQAGTITMTSFLPISSSHYEVQKTNAEYTAIFTPSHKLFSTSKVTISPPAAITTTSCTYITGSATITGAPSCTKTSSGWEILNLWNNADGDASTADYQGNQQISVQLGYGTNPTSQQAVGSWTVTTFNSLGGQFYKVDQGTSATSFTTTSGLITPQSITSSSFITGDRSAVYTINFNTQHNVPAGGLIEVILPSGISVANIGGTCSFSDAAIGLTPSSCTQVTGGIRITITTAHQAANNPLRIVVGNFENPRTFAPVSPFKIYSYDSLQNEIDEGSGLALAMTQMNELNGVTVTPGSQVNGASTAYTISFTSNLIKVLNDDQFYITFPSEISLSLSSCSTGSNIAIIICTRTGQQLKATMKSLNANTGTFTFVVNVAKNPPSTRPSSTFTGVTIQDSSSNAIVQYSSSITVTNTIAGTIISNQASLTQSNLLPNSASIFTVTFTPTNQISTTGAIVFRYPNQLIVATNAQCVVTTNTAYSDKCSIDNNSYTIKITGVFATAYRSSIKIQITGTTPISNQGGLGNFYFTTYDDTGLTYIIDELTQANSQLFLKLECDYPCKTCTSAISRSFCSSCWDPPNPSYLQVIPLSGTSNCQSSCSSGYTTDGSSSKICSKCDISCDTCFDNGVVGDKYKCVTCSDAFNYRLSGSYTCMSSCPSGYYPSTVLAGDNICSKCNFPCSECSGSASFCTKCDASSPTNILYNGGCVTSCPIRTTKIGSSCVNCNSPCLECSGSADLCISCDGTLGRKYLWSQSCVSECPSGTTTDFVNLKCIGCNTGCKQCDSVNQTHCYTCNDNLFNFYGTCMVACPQDFQVSSTRACEPLIISPPKPEIVYKNNTVYIEGKTEIVYVNVTSPNGTVELRVITNTTYKIIDLPLIYFPHLIAAGVMILVSFAGYLKDRQHIISSSIIALIGPIELIAYGVQIAFTHLQTSDMKLLILACVAFGGKLVLNLFSWFFYTFILKNDSGFNYWRSSHPHGSRCIACCGCSLSFKFFRFFYNYFFGFDSFKANFDNPKIFQMGIILFTILNWLLSYAPILFADISSLLNFSQFAWGTQLYITMIETLLLCIFSAFMTIFEFFRLNKLIQIEHHYEKVVSDSVIDVTSLKTNAITKEDNSELEKLLRQEMLKKIMTQVQGNRDVFLNNKLEDLLHKFGDRPCRSMCEHDNDKEEDPRECHSYPMTPKGQKEYEDFRFERPENFEFIQMDNVYAESVPPVPIELKVQKPKADAFIQAAENPMRRHGGSDMLGLNEEDDEDDYKKKRGKKLRRRGRKSEYHQKIDDEDELQVKSKRRKNRNWEDEDELEAIREEDDEDELGAKMSLLKNQDKSDMLQKNMSLADNVNGGLEMNPEEQKMVQDQKDIQEGANKKGALPKLDPKHRFDSNDQKKKKDEEKARKEQELKKKQEEEDKKKRIEEEKVKQLEQKKQKQEEKKKKRQEEKKRKEQEAIRKKEEEQRIKEEQKRKEEEDKRLREEEEQLRKEEEKRIKEEKRLQKQKEEQARLQKEEEERKEKELREQIEKEQKEKELKEKQEKERKEKELKDQAKKEKEEKERKERELKEYQERIEQEKKKEEERKKLEEEKKKNDELKKQEEIESMRQKLDEEVQRKEQEEQEKKAKEDQEINKLQDQIYYEAGDFGGSFAMGQKYLKGVKGPKEMFRDEVNPGNEEEQKQGKETQVNVNQNEPDLQVPPVADKRSFNENDILGNVDRDEKGNVKVEKDKNGNNVDKNGKRVNERGYLINPKTGDVIENSNQKKMFDKKDLDDRGEIPAPFCVEKYNFNPHNIRGDFDYDKEGNPKILKNKKGELVDKKGRKVNKKGYLVDPNGNILDKSGKKKFDKSLLNQEGDLPKLYNYNGRRYDAQDILGQFDKDSKGNAMLRMNNNGEYIDNKGRKVNEKGYLIDKDGNVIDKNGNKVFEKKYLKNNEIPKIFPFTKFNPKNIQGNFDLDPLGMPILNQNEKGENIDKDGRKLNQRGYLIDQHGNIIDKWGKKMFDRDILENDGEIPKIFRTGLLKTDSQASSLDRMMSEFERNLPPGREELEVANIKYKKEFAKLQNVLGKGNNNGEESKRLNTRRKDSDDSSVNSQMDDTPSNYNMPNMRYDHRKPHNYVDKIEEMSGMSGSDFGIGSINNDQFEVESGLGTLRKRKKKRRQIEYEKVKQVIPPGLKEKKMASAYGGVAQPITKMKLVRKKNNKHQTPHVKSSLSKLTDSLTGQGNEGGVDTSKMKEIFRDSLQQELHQNFYPENVNESQLKNQTQVIQNSLQDITRIPGSKRQGRPPKGPTPMGTDKQDFQKMFGDDVEEFLNNSDWDRDSALDSDRSRGMGSRGSVRVAWVEEKIGWLERET